MLKLLLSLGLLAVFLTVVEGQYEDVRCKCVCPAVSSQNKTTNNRKVFIRVFHEPSSCTCDNVVNEIPQGVSKHDFCARCECLWQRRNTTTIKIVVILVICVISLLVLYMLFLLCLDPLMSRRPKTYLEQHNEEVNLDTQAVTTSGMENAGMENIRPRIGVISRVKHEVSKVKGEQQKWKGTVQEQRKNIYDRHTMLN